MTILGLNAYHADSAACLMIDGRLVAAAEEERFRRIKHWAGLPTEAINYCLREGRLKWSEVDHIAINRKPGINNWRRLGFVLTHRPHPKLMWQKIRNICSAASIKETLQTHYNISIKAEVHHVEHHLAHLASAFLVSGFDQAACLSIDGFGDFASTALGFGDGSRLTITERVYFPHSLGILYSALTQFIGFPNYGDEYKVMGLAPYGQPAYLKQMRELVRIQRDGTFRLNLRYFRHHTDNVSYSWENCAPVVGTLYREALIDLLGRPRKPGEPLEQKHKDIARSVQTIYEEAFFELLSALHNLHPSDYLVLSGGCAMNSVANGKVYLCSPFKKMYLPAASGDAGGAIGAAVYTQSQITDHGSPTTLKTAYLGPASSSQEIQALLDRKKAEITEVGCRTELVTDERQLLRQTAEAITNGKIVGWFQGRMEWGPRALGNRSILADPRRTDMKEVLNAKIKRRESFRPFAPSILREAVPDWFEQEDDVPFMMEVFQIRPERRAQLPAVTHIDGSGRLQTVHKETNPRYHALISELARLTSIPIVLNTSFNENEPVVCNPGEALDCFLRTGMDILVLGDFYIEKSQRP
jgi:carbamoyltransferase